MQKTPNKQPFVVENNYIWKDVTKVQLGVGEEFVPLYLSRHVLNILRKTVNDKTLPKYAIETTSDLHRTTKKALISNTKTTSFKYRLIHTPSQTVWSKKKHKYQDGRKVFISLTNQYETFVDNC